MWSSDFLTKYAPDSLEEMVLNKDTRSEVQNFINTGRVCILTDAGVSYGKTQLAVLMLETLLTKRSATGVISDDIYERSLIRADYTDFSNYEMPDTDVVLLTGVGGRDMSVEQQRLLFDKIKSRDWVVLITTDDINTVVSEIRDFADTIIIPDEPSDSDVLAYLKNICKAESKEFADEIFNEILNYGKRMSMIRIHKGRLISYVREMITMLHHIIYMPGINTAEDIRHFTDIRYQSIINAMGQSKEASNG